MMSVRFLFLCQLILILYNRGSADRCKFPAEWRGRYFQHGLGELFIRDNSITTKGVCIEHNRDYYLFDNRDHNCFQCLLLIRQHENIIQYKESFCTSGGTLKVVCAHIRVETPLYTLVKEFAEPIPCPFSDAYYFNYNDLLQGSCEEKTSYAAQCASRTRYHLHFHRCQQHADFTSQQMEIECLATWKDGSEMFLYSRLSSKGITNKNDQYRCFNYQHYGSEIHLAMSADATCRGLRSARDGPVNMQFVKDTKSFPTSFCTFPSWMTSTSWVDLEGQYRYEFDDNNETLIRYRRRSHHKHFIVHSTFRCLTTAYVTDNDVVVSTFVTHNCVSRQQCIKLTRLDVGLIDFFQGESHDYGTNDKCVLHGSFQSFHMLIGDSYNSIPCPHPGVHHTAPRDGCFYRLDIGCNRVNNIEISYSCPSQSSGLRLTCVSSWKFEGKSLVILREGMHNLANCFSFREERGLMVFGLDPLCNRNITTITTNTFLLSRTEGCRGFETNNDYKTTTMMTTTNPPGVNSRDTNDVIKFSTTSLHHIELDYDIHDSDYDDDDNDNDLDVISGDTSSEHVNHNNDQYSPSFKPDKDSDFHFSQNRVQGDQNNKRDEQKSSDLNDVVLSRTFDPQLSCSLSLISHHSNRLLHSTLVAYLVYVAASSLSL